MTKYIDHITITVKGGDGGNGCVSFRREKYVPKGGPNGGSGGRGGHVYLAASPHVETLYDFFLNPRWEAKSGKPGEGSNKTGADAEDLYIQVPQGTTAYDQDGTMLCDLRAAGETFLIAKGGRGGRGNASFKSSVNRAPRIAQTGEEGEEKKITLDVKSIADIGLVGFPNAGKSTLITALTNARPEIAPYPFTTKSPVLGSMREGEEAFTIADIPGIIQNAHKGKGLGLRFLKHIERTKLLLFVIDCSQAEPPAHEAFFILRSEIDAYNKELVRNLPRLVALTKIDLVSGWKQAARLFSKKTGVARDTIIPVCALDGTNLDSLKGLIFETAKKSAEAQTPPPVIKTEP